MTTNLPDNMLWWSAGRHSSRRLSVENILFPMPLHIVRVWCETATLQISWSSSSVHIFCKWTSSWFIWTQILRQTKCLPGCKVFIFTRKSDFSLTNVRLSVSQSQKPPNSFKSSSFIIHPLTFIILHSSFLHFATFKLFSLFIIKILPASELITKVTKI